MHPLVSLFKTIGLGVDSPVFSAIVSKTGRFPELFGGFLETRIPGQNGSGSYHPQEQENGGHSPRILPYPPHPTSRKLPTRFALKHSAMTHRHGSSVPGQAVVLDPEALKETSKSGSGSK